MGAHTPRPFGQFWMIRRSASARIFPHMRVQRKRTLWVQAVSARSSSRQRFSRTSKFCSQAVASQVVRDAADQAGSKQMNRRTHPSAVRAILDDPPIRIHPNLPAHAGAKEKNPVGSSRFGTFIISPKVFTHQQILLTGCRESVRKGLISPGGSR